MMPESAAESLSFTGILTQGIATCKYGLTNEAPGTFICNGRDEAR